MSSQQLVRRLLRVTDYDAPPSVNPKTKRASTTTIDESKTSSQRPPPKRQRRRKHAVEEAITGSSESVMTEQEALDWHVRTRLLNVDRQMAVRGSLHSNTRAMDQSLQRLEAKTTTKQRASDTTLQSAVNAIRTGSGSRRLPPQNIPEPTFNKKRYAEEKKRKKMDELKKALKSLERDKKKKRKTK